VARDGLSLVGSITVMDRKTKKAPTTGSNNSEKT
jgi:hypothetical protein